jgi:predicted PurR-regulated permease PerM
VTPTSLKPRAAAGLGVQLLVLALIVLLGAIVWPVIGAVTLAGFLALVAWRPWCWLAARFGRRREIAAALATAAVLLVVLVPIAVIAYLGIEQVWSAVVWLEHQMASGGLHALIARLPRWLQPAAAHYGESAVALASSAAGYVPGLVGHVGRYLAEVFLAIVTLFYCFWRGPRIVDFVRRVSPLSSVHTHELLDEIDRIARGLFWGNVLIALMQGGAAAIGYAIVGVPAVFLLAGLTMFASFVPGIGTAAVWVPLTIALWFSGAHWNAIFLLAWAATAIGGLDHIVRPLLSRRGTRIPTLLVFLSIYGGLLLFGLKGFMLGPMFGALALSALRIVERERGGDEILVVTPVGAQTFESPQRHGLRTWAQRLLARVRSRAPTTWDANAQPRAHR